MIEREDPLETVTEILREPAELRPDFTERVMSAISRLPPVAAPAAARPVSWWHRQWTIRVSPPRILGLAAGLALLVLATQLLRRPQPEPAREEAFAGRMTQFVLVAPEASAVAVVGDFNDWSLSATPLERAAGDGVWYVTVPLEPGRYRYAFVVNGKLWRNDPEAPKAEDEFGRANSVVTVGGT